MQNSLPLFVSAVPSVRRGGKGVQRSQIDGRYEEAGARAPALARRINDLICFLRSVRGDGSDTQCITGVTVFG